MAVEQLSAEALLEKQQLSAELLSEEDRARVDQFLRSGVNRVARKPFRVWRLLAFVWLVLGGMSLVSYWIARQHGVI